MTDAVDSSLLVSLLREIRKEQNDQRGLLLRVAEQVGRMDGRLGTIEARIGMVEMRLNHLGDDLAVMIKSEIMGRLGHFETMIEQQIDALESRIIGAEQGQ